MMNNNSRKTENIDIISDDIENLINNNLIPWSELQGKSILITGATGLIGSLIVKVIAEYSIKRDAHIKIVACMRNKEKAEKLFGSLIDDGARIHFMTGSILDKISYNGHVDYIIHGAGITSSKMFLENPVETYQSIILGTNNVLEFAHSMNVTSMVFLSTMEIYGSPQSDDKIYEDDYHMFDHLYPRSSYPESKKMAENMCVDYGTEYHVPVKILRLTQTFGPGAEYGDKRVFAEFARCSVEKKDIILHTSGETKRSYLYTADAVSAIITVLLKGENCAAYNVANEATYCSILEMANIVAEKCTVPSVEVKIEIEDENKFGFATKHCMNLSTDKIRRLGWEPKYELEEMFHNLIAYYEQEYCEKRGTV